MRQVNLTAILNVTMKSNNLFKIYWFAALATIIICTLVGWQLGLAALLTVIVLTLLEVTFSADNAIINSKVLKTMSPLWQKLFMTVGIFIAVFVVRFILPIVIVMLSAHLGWTDVLNLALHHPEEYGHRLEESQAAINAFGGTFLLMIALSFFIDYEKKTHWLGFLERYLGKLGKIDNVTTLFMLLGALAMYFTVDAEHHAIVLIAAITATTLHISLDILAAALGDKGQKTKQAVATIGKAGLASFLYLEILDASFSLDGVIGAFALTNSVVIIMAGLGTGAVWVRAMTIHLVRSNVLDKYLFLSNGAHWAIGFLGGIMLLRLYQIELPEWLVGSLGLVFISAAVLWSIRHQKRSSRKTA